MKLYLTGPITGAEDGEICGWRSEARRLLSPEIELVDPASAPYDPVPAYKRPEKPAAAVKRLLHGRFVVDRNKHLIRTCDVVLANFLGAEKTSIGSVGELFWADALGKPIVIVREKSGNVHDHAMLNAIASSVCHTLPSGCDAVQNILGASMFGKTA